MNSLTIKDLQTLVALARNNMLGFGHEQIIIAGGAVRDLLLGGPVKDIDMFIGPDSTLTDADYSGEGNDFAVMALTFAERHLRAKGKAQPAHDNYPNWFDLVDVPGSRVTHGLPVQLIGIAVNPIDDVMNYDFSISQCFVTPCGLFMSDQCGKDMRDKIIRFTPEDGQDGFQWERSRKRLHRLRQKYPDWTLLGCDELTRVTAEDGSFRPIPVADDELL
ncbi:hypothetical protein D3C87_1196360 [compost metagenome]